VIHDRQAAQRAGHQRVVAHVADLVSRLVVALVHSRHPICWHCSLSTDAILRRTIEGQDTQKGTTALATKPPPPGVRISVELADLDYALPGTLSRRFMRCGKTNCRCKADPPALHGPYLHWTRTIAGKTLTRTLTDEQAARYQTWFDNPRRLRELIADLEARSLTAFNAAEDPPGKSSR